MADVKLRVTKVNVDDNLSDLRQTDFVFVLMVKLSITFEKIVHGFVVMVFITFCRSIFEILYRIENVAM